jgi:hypothetical protein
VKAKVYRPNQLHGSWRPCSLVDRRGPRFPDEYGEILVLEAVDIDDVFDQYASELGDVVFLGEGEDLIAYVAAPFGWELAKFGHEWKSPE